MIKFKKQKNNSGFAMLFTVLIISLILSISLGISNITLKQTILSSLAKDSQVAFYKADAAIECGMYYDTNDTFPVGTDISSATSKISCGNSEFSLDYTVSYNDYFVFKEGVASQAEPCATVVFDKVTNVATSESIVKGIGYSVCGESPRQVQRALQVTYGL